MRDHVEDAKRMRLFMHNITHFSLTMVMVTMTVCFLDSVPTFEGGSRVYGYMAHMMTEQDWGVVCALIAGVGLSTTFSYNWKARTASATVLCIAHLGFAGLFFMGNPYAPASYFFVAFGYQAACLAYSTAYLGERISPGMAYSNPPGPLAR